jgi:hypothetical protein
MIADEVQDVISNAGFHLIQVPHVRKNALDNQLMVDAIDLSHLVPYTHVVLVAADGDYYSLCNQFLQRKIAVSIISRKGNISGDLLNLSVDVYFVAKDGHIYQNLTKSNEDQISIIEMAMQDAQLALERMALDSDNAGIEVFSYVDWERQYLNLGTFQVPPPLLLQLLSREDFFRCYLERGGFGHSKEFDHFYYKPTSGGEDLREVKIIQNLPPSCVVSIPLDPQLMELIVEGETTNEVETESEESIEVGSETNDFSFLMQPIYIQAGRDVLYEVMSAKPQYAYILFSVAWNNLKQRFGELATMMISASHVPVEFFEEITKNDNTFQLNKSSRRWEINKSAAANELNRYTTHLRDLLTKIKKKTPARTYLLTTLKNDLMRELNWSISYDITQLGFKTFGQSVDAVNKQFDLGIKVEADKIHW